jgi:hypothetical protein
MVNKPFAMLKLRQVLRDFTEGTSKKQKFKVSEKEKKLIFNLRKPLFTLFKKQYENNNNQFQF